MSYVCNICGKSFANASNRHRHIKGVHINIVHEAKSHPRKEQSLAIGSTVMQHPFTCIVASCTQSGIDCLGKETSGERQNNYWSSP